MRLDLTLGATFFRGAPFKTAAKQIEVALFTSGKIAARKMNIGRLLPLAEERGLYATFSSSD
jgi:hypothetical protein